jgi:hypothetical protein
MAATTNLLKVTQLSKDMNMKSKDVLEVLAGKGVNLKSQATLEPAQFDVLFEALTKENQIDNIGNYLDGVTYIPSKKKPAAAKPKEEPVATAQPVEAKPEAKVEAKPEVKAEQKPEVKEVKTEQKSAEAPKAKPEAKVEAKPEIKEIKKEEKKEVPVEKKETVAAPKVTKPQETRPAPKTDAPRTDARQPQQRPAAPTRDGGKPYGNSAPQFGQRPAQQGQRFEQRGQFGGQNNQTDRNNRPFDKNAQFGQRGGAQQRSQGQRNDHFGGGFDKEDRQQRGPVNSFKPQPIVRSQTAKGDEAPKQRGATRVVDMRAGSVDLSKYDERLDNFVPDSVADARGGNQRVKKQAPGRMQPMGG